MACNAIVRNLVVFSIVSAAAPAGWGQCEPLEVARLAVGGDANELEVSGDLRYVAWGSEGLVVLQADGPDDMERIGMLGLPADAMTLEVGAGVVFVGGGTEVFAIDVSSPRYPVLLDSFDVGGVVNELDLRGSVLYVAAGDAGLRVVNVSNPAAMSLRGSLATAAPARGVDAAGTKAYLTTAGGAFVLDVSNPSSPVVLSEAPGTGVVRVTQTRAYVVDGLNDRVRIMDISTPTQPRVLATLHDDELAGYGAEGVIAMRIVNGTLYLALLQYDFNHGCGVDIDSTIIGVYDLTADTFNLTASGLIYDERGSSVAMIGSQIAVTIRDGWSDGVRTFDVAGGSLVPRMRFVEGRPSLVGVRPDAGEGAGVLGLWIEKHNVRRSAHLQTMTFGAGRAPGLTSVQLPTGDYPEFPSLTLDGDFGFVIVAESGPSGADCWSEVSGAGLIPVDLSDLSDPVVHERIHLPNAFLDPPRLGVEPGARLYVYGLYESIDIYDSTEPSAPVLIGSFNPYTVVPGAIYSVVPHNGYLYVTKSSNGLKLQVFDAADPEHVQSVGLQLTDWHVRGRVGNHLIASTPTGITVVSLSNPVAPREIARVPLAHSVSQTSISSDFFAYGDGEQITILDLSDPSYPRPVATIPGATRIFLSDDGATLYALRGDEIVKILVTPAGPLEVLATAATADTAMDVSLAPNQAWAYVSDLTGGVRVFDVSDPADPVAIDAFTELDRAYQTVVVGAPEAELGYIAGGASGLVIMSAEIPTAHGFVAAHETSDLALAVAVGDGFAYVAARFDGLQVFDVSVPGVITPVGSVDTPGSAQGVTLDGSHVYIADGSGGVHVVDVSVRSNPVIVGSYDTPLSARMVSIQGSVAYVPDRTTGLIALDVSDPTDPRLIGTLGGLGDTRSVSISGHTAFVADFDGFVHRVDISNPTAMWLVESVETLSTPRAVAADGSFVFVADGDAGVTVLEAPACWDTSCPADVNGDDALDFFDVQAFLNAYSSDGGLADWNDDGVLDFFDVQAFLNDFSAGC